MRPGPARMSPAWPFLNRMNITDVTAGTACLRHQAGISAHEKLYGLVGRKAGMTRVFTDAGETVPVTVIEVLPNRVTQVKSEENDGYRAVQVTFGTKRPQLLSKAAAGPLREGERCARARGSSSSASPTRRARI